VGATSRDEGNGVEEPAEGSIPSREGQEASNVVALRHASIESSHESVDESQLLEECYPDTPEPARGKNKRSKE
jgi:hypothetical protein